MFLKYSRVFKRNIWHHIESLYNKDSGQGIVVVNTFVSFNANKNYSQSQNVNYFIQYN